jgi:hypothetical protein
VPVEAKPLAHDEGRAGQRAVDVTAGELPADEQVRPGVLVQHRARRIERLVGVLTTGSGSNSTTMRSTASSAT